MLYGFHVGGRRLWNLGKVDTLCGVPAQTEMGSTSCETAQLPKGDLPPDYCFIFTICGESRYYRDDAIIGNDETICRKEYNRQLHQPWGNLRSQRLWRCQTSLECQTYIHAVALGLEIPDCSGHNEDHT